MAGFEIASAIQNYVTSHSGVTDSPISLRQIRDEVDTLRLRLLDDLFRSRKSMVDVSPYAQTATVSTEKVDGKLQAHIPELYYQPNGKLGVQFLGSSSQETPFKVVFGRRAIWSDNDLYTGKVPTAIYQGSIVTFRNVAPKSIFIEAVFNKPSELTQYGYDWKKSHYPVPYGMIDHIIGKTAESYLRLRQPVLPTPNTQSDENVQGIQQTKQT